MIDWGEFLLPKIRNPGSLGWLANEVSRLMDAIGGERSRRTFFWPGGSAQPVEKAQSRQGNPRKSKPFSLIFFAPV
jgi:hypothetical protein